MEEQKTKLDWKKFESQFGTWAQKIKPFFDIGGFDPIYDQLKKDSARGKSIAPLSSNVFRCFLETPYDELKLVIMGMCPYHTMKNGIPIADGLLMGCSTTGYPQPPLDQFYDAIETELHDGLNLVYKKNPDVSYLAEQGVLMLNAALTTEMNKAGSHIAIWEPFIKYLFEEIINNTGVPVLFLGKEASKYEKYTAPFSWVFNVSHPASASYKNAKWDSEGVFKKLNKVLKDTNDYNINWLDVTI